MGKKEDNRPLLALLISPPVSQGFAEEANKGVRSFFLLFLEERSESASGESLCGEPSGELGNCCPHKGSADTSSSSLCWGGETPLPYSFVF